MGKNKHFTKMIYKQPITKHKMLSVSLLKVKNYQTSFFLLSNW